jgi:hypothetical protein
MRPKVERTLMLVKDPAAENRVTVATLGRMIPLFKPKGSYAKEEASYGLLGTPRPAIIDSTLHVPHDIYL